ncbi:hypothetical protein [Streptomyces sp. NPDC001635]|nr:hypothetical protein E4K10_47280 [Streptomyces sp. T1317-0309]
MRKTTTARRVSASVLLAGTLLMGVAAQGNAFAVDHQIDTASNDDDQTTVDLLLGGQEKVPFGLPGTVGVKGLPADVKSGDASSVLDGGDSQIRSEFKSVAQKMKQNNPGMDLPTGDDVRTALHRNWDKPSLWYQATGKQLQDYCAKDEKNCGFVGDLTKKAPLINASTMMQGPKTVTVTDGWTETNTHAETKGWSVGGTIELSNAAGTGKGSGVFSYNQSATDTYEYATNHQEAIHTPVDAGKWHIGQVHFVGGEYTGYIAVHYPKGALRVKGSAIGNLNTQHAMEEAIDGKSPFINEVRGFSNGKDIVELFPVKTNVRSAKAGMPAAVVVDSTTRAAGADAHIQALWQKYDAAAAKFNSLPPGAARDEAEREMHAAAEGLKKYGSAPAPTPNA